MPVGVVAIQGERQLILALKAAQSELKVMFERELRQTAERVAEEAQRRADKYGGGPMRGRLRGFSAVAESRARSQHIRPQFGELMMRKALLPARSAKYEESVRSIEHALDMLVEHADGGYGG